MGTKAVGYVERIAAVVARLAAAFERLPLVFAGVSAVSERLALPFEPSSAGVARLSEQSEGLSMRLAARSDRIARTSMPFEQSSMFPERLSDLVARLSECVERMAIPIARRSIERTPRAHESDKGRTLALGRIVTRSTKSLLPIDDFDRLTVSTHAMNNNAFILTLASTGFSVAFLHAAIPTHWLPFVMVGRARNWTRRQIELAVALAGGGHVLATTLLGIGLARFGFELNERFDHAFHWVVSAILIALGLWLAFRKPHGHECVHCQGHPDKIEPAKSDKAVLWGLFLSLTLSPCELFLPVYLTASPYGWPGILLLSAVLATATLGGMMTLTWLTLAGVQKVRWRWLEHPSQRVIGGLLCLLGIATVSFAH